MKAPKEIRRWANELRKRYGRRNGVVYRGLWDDPGMEVKWANSKRSRRRQNSAGSECQYLGY
jgi:hypothetical protein